MTRFRSDSVRLVSGGALLTAIALFTSACGDSPDETVEVCVDADTGQRVEDHYCDNDSSHSHFYPYYYPYGTNVHGVGQKVSGGTTTRPAGGSFVKAPLIGKTYNGGSSGG